MSGERGDDWDRKIAAILDGFDFGHCIIYLKATGWQGLLSAGGHGLLCPGEAELRRLAGKLLRLVADNPEPVNHSCAAGLVAMKSEEELSLYFAIAARAA
jgi:hypothetical protein